MKRCPTCNKTFTERNLSFCIDDGTPLVPLETLDDEATVVSPSSGGDPTIQASNPAAPPYQPPSGYASPGTTTAPVKRKVWPWILGTLLLLLLLLVGIGIAAAIFVPKMLRERVDIRNTNGNSNVNRSERVNPNRNGSNSNQENTNTNGVTNDNSASDENASAPTDEQLVLSQLTDLENEWTVANINADKKKLDRILADDYVGKNAAGVTEGKADYLRTIQRDTSIQKWDFENLKVELRGDHADLTGIVRLQVDDKPRAFTFKDKFVWRDGRWQAVGSDIAPLQE